jgi:hypothetical protein
MTRLNPKYTRVYANGYDVSGTARDYGTIGTKISLPTGSAFSDEIENTPGPDKANIVCGPISAFLSPSAAIGLHELMSAGNVITDIMIVEASVAEPAVGAPAFVWKMQEAEYLGNGEEIVGVDIAFPDAAYNTVKGYNNPFGLLVHAKGAETGANTAVGRIDNGADSALGGIFAWQLFSSNGTVTLSIDDSATNANNAAFAALSGATSGSIDATTTPKSGMVALGVTATVRRYLRWQLAFGSADTATFALVFIRGV